MSQKQLGDASPSVEGLLVELIGAVRELTGELRSKPEPPDPASEGVQWISISEAAARLGIHRTTLDALVNQKAHVLPGAVVNVSSGSLRRRYRFDQAMLGRWLALAQL